MDISTTWKEDSRGVKALQRALEEAYNAGSDGDERPSEVDVKNLWHLLMVVIGVSV